MPTFTGVTTTHRLGDVLYNLIAQHYTEFPVHKFIYEDFEKSERVLDFGVEPSTAGSYRYGNKCFYLATSGSVTVSADFSIEYDAVVTAAARVGGTGSRIAGVVSITIDDVMIIEQSKSSSGYTPWFSGACYAQPGQHLVTVTARPWSGYEINCQADNIAISQYGLNIDAYGVSLVTDAANLQHSGVAVFCPYSANCEFDLPVQYLVKVEPDHIIIAVQGAYNVNTTAQTHLVYVGKLGTPQGVPAAYGAASTLSESNLCATLTDSRIGAVSSVYDVYPSLTLVSPDIQNRFALVPIYVYRNGENWRAWFKNLYVAQIPPQTMLDGETVTALKGDKYTFFKTSLSGNEFLAADAVDQWLVVKH